MWSLSKEIEKTNKLLKKMGINHSLIKDPKDREEKVGSFLIQTTHNSVKIKLKNKIIFQEKNKKWTEVDFKISPCKNFVSFECEYSFTDISYFFVYNLNEQKVSLRVKQAFIGSCFLKDSRLALSFSTHKGFTKKYQRAISTVYDFKNKTKKQIYNKAFKNITWVNKFGDGLVLSILNTNKKRIVVFDKNLKVVKSEKTLKIQSSFVCGPKLFSIVKTPSKPLGVLKDFLSGKTVKEIQGENIYSSDGGDKYYALGSYDKNLNQRIRVFNLNHTQIKSIKVDKYSEIESLFFEKNKLTAWLKTPFGEKKISYDVDKKKLTQKTYFFKGYKNIEVSHKIINNCPVIFYKKRGDSLKNKKSLVYVYGGFEDTCFISVERYVPFIKEGGLFINVWPRGNSHEALFINKIGNSHGKKGRSVSDTISVVKELKRRKIVDPQNISIVGFSNGGFMVGAILNKAPELFSSAITSVGVMDMQKYRNFTGGEVWSCEYGLNNKEIKKICPLTNIKQGYYPPVYVQSGKFDTRVVPHHQISYAKKLKENSLNPVYFEQMNSGHARGEFSWKNILKFIFLHQVE